MNRKVLPLTNTPITSYHYHADLLSVILCKDNYNYPDSYPEDYNTSWLYNNHINLEAPPINGVNDFRRFDFHIPFSAWKTCPFVYYQRLSRDMVRAKWDNVVEFVIDSINLGNYICLDFDRYYLENTFWYKQKHLLHDLFVYGYDSDKQVVFFAEYLEHGRYTHSEMSFDEFITGCESAFNTEHEANINGFELIKPRDERYDFDIRKVTDGIVDYLSSKCSAIQQFNSDNIKYYRQKFVYGIEIYNHVLYYLEYYALHHTDLYDQRMFHVLEEHKTVMLSRLQWMGNHEFLNNADSLCERYAEVKEQATVLKALHMKLNLVSGEKKTKLLANMAEKVKSLRKAECEMLSDVLLNIDERPIEYIETFSERRPKVTVPDINFDRWRGFNHNLGKLYPIHGDWKAMPSGLAAYGNNEVSKERCELDPHNGFMLSSCNVKDFRLDADICVLYGVAAALMFRTDDELTKFYCANIDANDGYVKLWKPINGLSHDLVTVKLPIQREQWYHLAVEAQGNEIKVYFDGKLVINHTDEEHSEGLIGFNMYYCVGKFQNVIVKDL